MRASILITSFTKLTGSELIHNITFSVHMAAMKTFPKRPPAMPSETLRNKDGIEEENVLDNAT